MPTEVLSLQETTHARIHRLEQQIQTLTTVLSDMISNQLSAVLLFRSLSQKLPPAPVTAALRQALMLMETMLLSASHFPGLYRTVLNRLLLLSQGIYLHIPMISESSLRTFPVTKMSPLQSEFLIQQENRSSETILFFSGRLFS